MPRHATVEAVDGATHLLAEQRSLLWTEAPASEASLVEGKVHNLRRRGDGAVRTVVFPASALAR